LVMTLCRGVAWSSSHADWQRWESYKAHFLSAGGRIVDWSADQRTTSEGQAYALFFALVANDRASFDRIVNWTAQHLAQGDLREHLPAWLWQRSANGEWGIGDSNSASDADLWMAYTLIEAGEAWHEPAYLSQGRSLAARIEREEVAILPGKGPMLLPGRRGFHTQAGTFVVNPSYLPLQLLTALNDEFPQGPWRDMATIMPEMLQSKIGHGFAMDWVGFREHFGFFATLRPSSPASGSYDAIRVYLWAGMLHPKTAGRKRLLSAMYGMRLCLRNRDFPPERIDSEGKATENNGSVGFSACVIPFLSALSEESALRKQEARVREISNSSEFNPGEQRYYDHNLVLFAEGWSEGRFQFTATGHLRLIWMKL
jgi:endoglucanase